MIISTSADSKETEFEHLLSVSTEEMQGIAEKEPEYFLSRRGLALEDDLAKSLSLKAKGTSFENTIKKYSAYRFPDIVVNKYYGVEVKSTEKNHWVTTGNSVLESTRVDNVDRVYLFFGKLSNPINFKWKHYEECMREVVVTHSPRYLIDMNIEEKDTIFSKIGLSYDDIRKMTNPIKPIVDYYRSLLQPGEDMWWIDNESRVNLEVKSTSMILSPWSSVIPAKKIEIASQMMALFPEVFSSSPSKFNRPSSWLVSRHSIVHPNLRDTFTAGGQDFLPYPYSAMGKLPRIFLNLYENLGIVFRSIIQLPIDELHHYWGVSHIDDDKITQWINLVMKNSSSLLTESRRFKYMLIQKKEAFGN